MNELHGASGDTLIDFDADEYLHLAVYASSRNDCLAAMGYARHALRLKPESAAAHYILALLHAELGLVDRAVRGLGAALERQPSLEPARLRLGALLMSRRRLREAKEQFAMLGSSADHALRFFSEGLVALVDNRLEDAKEKITSGLAADSTQPALAQWMQSLLTRLLAGEDGEEEGGHSNSAAGESAALRAYLQASNSAG